ncbi:MAG: hypothetical protein PWP25_372 [Sphaerochaeta sp.]|jgi:hypothetical protein|uniref:Sel1 repeat family protein n=1 Tax=Sphaerochaeta halotolerans TaxID=2293840 RepID=A0A372MGW6_9SPIR|nr:hypothetical protein [Sphaerochaeta halotolerans]MBG0766201.1 hypothetical protein [Spirochaetaceae bacterium]MDK2859186.1 hypothetical protein [Sphaerochaeta sp.]MDN5333427.1 hypothetical protein [Sphaerochaeta sp.]RFU94638.1 hypothetical protein DYP60_09005 [Sphaerochaeta halotolerans]
MKKTQWWKLLLFSFFLVLLLSSCAEDTPLLQELAQHGEWDALYHAAKKDFSETYRSGSLYYIALAQTERGDDASALRSLELYQEMTGESGASIAARNLMLILAERTGNAEMVVQQAVLLDEMGVLGTQGAKAYYQALMTLGHDKEAGLVFATHLREQLNRSEYALLLLEAEAPLEKVRDALGELENGEVVSLFATVASRQPSSTWAQTLVSLAQEYEQVELTPQERQVLYASLATLCTQADFRVLANKYQTLSQE